MTGQSREEMLAVALNGMMIGALGEAIGEMAKELRRYAGSNFNKSLDSLEAKAIRSIENAAIDIFPESDQLRLIEQTRKIIAAKYRDIRTGA